MQWFKLYSEFASDPKVQTMSEQDQRRLIMLYCLRCTADLSHLTDDEIRFALGISRAALERTKTVFVAKGFVDEDWSMPKWEKRQAPFDPTAAQRMRDYRKRHAEQDRNVTRNGPVPRARAEALDCIQPALDDVARAPAVTVPVTPPDPDGGKPPPPPQAPAYAEVHALVDRLSVDPAWGPWAEDMAREGYPAKWVLEVLKKLSARGPHQLRIPLATAILEDYRRNGGPDHAEKPGGRPTAPAPAAPSRAVKPRRIPEGPAGNALRAMWADVEKRPIFTDVEARKRSIDCPCCSGAGWARVFRIGEKPALPTGRPTTVHTYCLCPIGEWMRSRNSDTTTSLLPDLADVLAGQTRWTTQEPGDGPGEDDR